MRLPWTIYGYTDGDKKSNTATGGDNRGHAVLVIEGSTRTRGLRNVTAGPRVKLDSKTTGGAGNWEN